MRGNVDDVNVNKITFIFINIKKKQKTKNLRR